MVLEKVQVNLEFVRASVKLLEAQASGRVVVARGDAQRVVHVLHGHFVQATSNLPTDRIGELLAAEGKLEVALLAPLAAEAKRLGLLFGDLLIVEGLLTPAELAAVLERQAISRFERTLLMKGEVQVQDSAPTRPATRRSVIALVVELFREKVPFEAAEALVLERLRKGQPSAPALQRLRALKLAKHELELCGALEDVPFSAVFDGLDPATPGFRDEVRFLGALEALGLFG